MRDDLDLGAYLDRIGWGETPRQDLATLSSLLRAHMASIPFENLDVLLGRTIRLDLEGLQDKLVRARRGGYCFEHGTLLAAALEQLGFRPLRHAARVVVFVPWTAAPRTHMFLSVETGDGRFIVDPGFGALAPRVPVPLAEGERVWAGNECHWMVRDGHFWKLCAEVDGKAVDAWVSTVEEENPVDFEMGNHFTSTHPSSPFVNRIMLRALTADGRIGVLNRDVTVWCRGTRVATRLADRPALRALLAEQFGFDLPEIERLRVPSLPEWP